LAAEVCGLAMAACPQGFDEGQPVAAFGFPEIKQVFDDLIDVADGLIEEGEDLGILFEMHPSVEAISAMAKQVPSEGKGGLMHDFPQCFRQILGVFNALFPGTGPEAGVVALQVENEVVRMLIHPTVILLMKSEVRMPAENVAGGGVEIFQRFPFFVT
jgi:hypothetical protein